MTENSNIGAVILAAGLSSRMGVCKPLLRLGAMTALERGAGSLKDAGVRDVVVVTGHDREQISPEIRRLGLREAHNPDYRLGMFTSIQTGARSLPHDVDAFFVLPVDCALVGPAVAAALTADYRLCGGYVTYPTCCGRRGHPPLVAARLRAALESAPPGSDLRTFLHEHAVSEREVEVDAISILLDMDTIEDYRRLAMFAELIDRRGNAAATQEPPTSDEDARYLLAALQVEERVIRHCRAVAEVAQTLAEALNAGGSRLDLRLVRSAALLHDMAKGHRRHASAAQDKLTALGLPALGEAVGAHMVLPEHQLDEPCVSESQVVYLAVKMVVEDTPGSLETRTEYALRTYGRDDASKAAIKRRIRAARTITAKIEAALGRSIEDILAR